MTAVRRVAGCRDGALWHRATPAVALLLSALLPACSAETRGRTTGAPAPLTRSALPPAPSGAAPGVLPGPLDLEGFAPWLTRPELAPALAALEEDDPRRAAAEALRVSAEPPGDVAHHASLFLLAARLAEGAALLETAAERYGRALALEGPLQGYARVGLARVELSRGRPAAARALLVEPLPEGPAGAEARTLLARAALDEGDLPRALRAADAGAFGSPDAPGSVDVPRALRLVAAWARAPRGDAPVGAAEAESAARLWRLARLAARGGEELAELARVADELARSKLLSDGSTLDPALELRALEAAGAGPDVRRRAEALIAGRAATPEGARIACEAALVAARAASASRDHAGGALLLERELPRCAEADVRARMLFLAGKLHQAGGRSAPALAAFGAVEREHRGHRLADDARLRAAQVELDLGAEDRFTALLTRMPDDYPAGDMVPDGLFELGLRRLERADPAGALTALERARALTADSDAARGAELAGRERYFHARALALSGETAAALAELEAIVAELPLAYYSLHAWSRLSAVDPGRAAQALERARADSLREPFVFPTAPAPPSAAFTRALELLRASDVPAAARELEVEGATSTGAAPALAWTAAFLYARAGAPALSAAAARTAARGVVGRWPFGEWVVPWQLAFPRPFAREVAAARRRSDVSESLVYAIMREESAFDPRAQSAAGAYGLLQLIEPTARRYGRALGLAPTPASLLTPRVNVPIGVRMLEDLGRIFERNPLLAIPAYNAGPGRPRRWMAERGELDFDLWVERIPFGETRRYTKRVLASRATYAFLYGGGDAAAALTLPLRAAGPAAGAEPLGPAAPVAAGGRGAGAALAAPAASGVGAAPGGGAASPP